MTTALKAGWSKPSTILFACESPANEKAFAFALAQACEFGADMILFHAYNTLTTEISDSAGVFFDYAAAARDEIAHLRPLQERVRKAGLRCEVVARPGLAADQILAYVRQREVDRVVMGTHAPGPIGKLLVGSVAEAVLRSANVPVCIVGPGVVDGAYRNFATRTILCAVSLQDSSHVVAEFAAELAAQHRAALILEHVLRPHEHTHGHTIPEMEAALLALVPAELQDRISVQTVIVPGDPTEELLYQSRARQADLMVLGAQGASAFAAVTRHGVVYKVLAHAQCPVITLSPIVLAESGAGSDSHHDSEAYLSGVF